MFSWWVSICVFSVCKYCWFGWSMWFVYIYCFLHFSKYSILTVIMTIYIILLFYLIIQLICKFVCCFLFLCQIGIVDLRWISFMSQFLSEFILVTALRKWIICKCLFIIPKYLWWCFLTMSLTIRNLMICSCQSLYVKFIFVYNMFS